ncbi:hypothetical protein PQR62_18705 [Herbaspirillum lusitanum]|uniref:Uncharacterized protein n=1 Tax=Herbaspirillum lusitanum TaxID=213312 RepID=A0ABW9ABN6_9BURK
MSPDNEVQIGRDVYVFASPSVARSFSTCLMKDTLGKCKEDFPPLNVRVLSAALDDEENGDDAKA